MSEEIYLQVNAYTCPECGGSVDLDAKGMYQCTGGCELGDYTDCECCEKELVGLPETVCEGCKVARVKRLQKQPSPLLYYPMPGMQRDARASEEWGQFLQSDGMSS